MSDTTYIERVRLAASRYADSANPDGGWGLFAHGYSSIVNTAEVLAVLRTASHQADAPAVQGGIRFLIQATREHPLPKKKPGGRGEHTRYAGYGLLGLSEYENAARQPDVAEAIEGCIRVLERFARAKGGWPEMRGERPLSLFQTATGIIALQRVAPGHRLIEPAVKAMLGLRKAGGYRARSGPGDPSVPHTALAAIALRQVGYRREAGAAAAWLGERPATWCDRIHSDSGVPGTGWTHMSFGLGLRALVLAGDVACDDSRIRAARKYIDELWSASEQEWRDGSVEEDRTSVRATYATVLAYRALAYRAGRDAVNDELAGGSKGRPRAGVGTRAGRGGARPVVQMLTTPEIEVDGHGDRPEIMPIGERPWELLRHIVAAQNGGATALSVSAIADEFFAGVSATPEATAARTLRRINERAGCKLVSFAGGMVTLVADVRR